MGNTPPTIAASPVTRTAGSPRANSQIATVSDLQDASIALQINASLQGGSGVTLNNLSVDANGKVRADIQAQCGATTSTFTLTVTDSTNLSASVPLTVTVNTATSISQSPTTQSKLVGQSATFSVTAAGTNLSYQWRKNGNAINGATASSYTIATVVLGDARNYDVVVNGACGSAASSAATLTVNMVRGAARFSGDYDGDGKADLIVWRASTATFWAFTSGIGSVVTKQLGVSTDVPVPGDYDGDGQTDLAVWRASTFWIYSPAANTSTSKQWGVATDVPVPEDYDGDGQTDFAIWRPSTRVWWVYRISHGSTMTAQWGTSDDMPVR